MTREIRWALGTIAISVFVLVVPIAASADIVPWRAGEPRSIGIGSCAKGPCLRHYDFSPSKPHIHVGGKRIFNPYGPHYRAIVPRDDVEFWRHARHHHGAAAHR